MRLTTDEVALYGLRFGDFLVNRVNSRELVGKAAVVGRLPEPFVFESKNIRVRFLQAEHVPEFANVFFQTRQVRGAFEGDAKQTCGQASVNQPQVANLLMPVPPLAEQRRIVAKVKELLALCDELEAWQTAAREIGAKLLDSLIHHALNP
jgi:type I restriction enzyme S subunit